MAMEMQNGWLTVSINEVREHDQGQYAAEASALGLKPGQWPHTVGVAGIGGDPSTRWFDKLEEDVRDNGELLSYAYVNHPTGMLVTIFND